MEQTADDASPVFEEDDGKFQFAKVTALSTTRLRRLLRLTQKTTFNLYVRNSFFDSGLF